MNLPSSDYDARLERDTAASLVLAMVAAEQRIGIAALKRIAASLFRHADERGVDAGTLAQLLARWDAPRARGTRRR